MLEVGPSNQPFQIQYDERRWPVVVITFSAGSMTDAQLAEHLRDIDAYAKRGGPYGFVVDARALTPPNTAQRRVMTESMDANSRRDGARFLGVAVVLNSAPARAVFKAVLWLRQGDHPLTAVGSVEEGLRWLRALGQKTAAAG